MLNKVLDDGMSTHTQRTFQWGFMKSQALTWTVTAAGPTGGGRGWPWLFLVAERVGDFRVPRVFHHVLLILGFKQFHPNHKPFQLFKESCLFFFFLEWLSHNVGAKRTRADPWQESNGPRMYYQAPGAHWMNISQSKSWFSCGSIQFWGPQINICVYFVVF